MSIRDHRSRPISVVHPGDVPTVRTGYPGTSCVLDVRISEANCIGIIISRPGTRITAKFWALWVNPPFAAKQILQTQAGIVEQHFTIRESAAVRVAEQRTILDRFTSVATRIAAEHQVRVAQQALKSSLMDDLLTGRVRVTPLLDFGAA